MRRIFNMFTFQPNSRSTCRMHGVKQISTFHNQAMCRLCRDWQLNQRPSRQNFHGRVSTLRNMPMTLPWPMCIGVPHLVFHIFTANGFASFRGTPIRHSGVLSATNAARSRWIIWSLWWETTLAYDRWLLVGWEIRSRRNDRHDMTSFHMVWYLMMSDDVIWFDVMIWCAIMIWGHMIWHDMAHACTHVCLRVFHRFVVIKNASGGLWVTSVQKLCNCLRHHCLLLNVPPENLTWQPFFHEKTWTTVQHMLSLQIDKTCRHDIIQNGFDYINEGTAKETFLASEAHIPMHHSPSIFGR